MSPEKSRRASELQDTTRGLPSTIYRLAVLLIPLTIAIWCNLAYTSSTIPIFTAFFSTTLLALQINASTKILQEMILITVARS